MCYITQIFYSSLLCICTCQLWANQGSDNNYAYLENQLMRYKKDTAKSWKIAEEWLKKAKKDNNPMQMVQAFKAKMHFSEYKFRKIYADSMLQLALDANNNELIGNAYLSIGASHYGDKNFSLALENYILANNYLVHSQDEYLIHKVKYSIALTKHMLGYHHEAVALLSDCIHFFKEENDMAYLKSMHAISLAYIQLNRTDLAAYYNKMGEKLAKEYEIPNMQYYFQNAEGINLFFQKKYQEAIALFEKTLGVLQKENDFANSIATYNYLGRSNWELHNPTKALHWYLKMNEGIVKNNYYRPEFRDGYEKIIEYYQNTGKISEQLFYVNLLLEFDKKSNLQFKDLTQKVHQEYDTKTLLAKKESLQQSLKQKNTSNHILMGVIGLIVLSAIIWRIKNKLQKSKKVKRILEIANKPKEWHTNPEESNIPINPELQKSILKNLEKFEQHKKYIEKDMTLSKLANLLHTNTKYVSLIIAHYRGKKTINYINDLKVDHVVDLLVHHHKFRNYTNQALAEEAGFGSTQIFTKSFKSKTGLSPTSFINELNKSAKNTTS